MKKVAWITLGGVLGAALVWTAQAQQSLLAGLPFSPAREAGDTVFLSGQIGRGPDGAVVPDTIEDETRQTMKNLEATLAEHGCTWKDVVNVTVYLRDMEDYAGMNAAYREFFDGPFPARATIGGVQIAFGLRVEISAIAHKPS